MDERDIEHLPSEAPDADPGTEDGPDGASGDAQTVSVGDEHAPRTDARIDEENVPPDGDDDTAEH